MRSFPLLLALSLLPATARAETIYVTNEKAATISVIDGASLKVTATWPVGKRPRGLLLSKDGRYLYVCASDANAVQIVDRATASSKAAEWRRQGLKVGFTNGCFDLLHPGHISLLRQARGACDRLVVGLNSDASVRRLKGETRPVQNESARATVMASLASVDLVVIFAEDTPAELIKQVRPDVLVKGADYKKEQVVGWDTVEGYGGRVALAPLVDGKSTSAVIQRILEAYS